VLTQRGWIPARDLTFIDCALNRNSDPPRGRLGDFVRVVSVSPAGRSDVWDCEVEGLHNFVANGIVVHNCLFEAMQPCPECLGKKCPLYAWENPQTGKYEELCQGRALRSDGFLRYEDVIDEFLRTDSATYQVQKLLEAPERGALIYPRFDPVLHGRSVPEHIRREASVGIGVDWGFDHPEVFSVWAQTGDGRYWGLEEIGRRFLSPSEEMEIAQDLNNKYARAVGTRPNGTSIKAYPTFFCGKDRPQSIRAFAESGLIVVGNEPRLRDDGHKEVRRLLDPNKGPLVAIDPVTMPMTIHELSTMHRDEKGREVLKDNDYGDATRHVLATSALMGGIQAGGGIVR